LCLVPSCHECAFEVAPEFFCEARRDRLNAKGELVADIHISKVAFAELLRELQPSFGLIRKTDQIRQPIE
jgi:hypothetical protein